MLNWKWSKIPQIVLVVKHSQIWWWQSDCAYVLLDPEAVWEESQVPVWRDELGSARHSPAHSPTPKETMKEGGRDARMRGERDDCLPLAFHYTK